MRSVKFCAKIGNLKNSKGKKAMTFLFRLDQKLKKIAETMNANDYMKELANTIMETVDKFAPEKRVENCEKHEMET